MGPIPTFIQWKPLKLYNFHMIFYKQQMAHYLRIIIFMGSRLFAINRIAFHVVECYYYYYFSMWLILNAKRKYFENSLIISCANQNRSSSRCVRLFGEKSLCSIQFAEWHKKIALNWRIETSRKYFFGWKMLFNCASSSPSSIRRATHRPGDLPNERMTEQIKFLANNEF